VSRPRTSSDVAQLARLGFDAPEVAAEDLRSVGNVPAELLGALAEAADPDLALQALRKLLEAAPDSELLRDELARSADLRDRLTAVLGASDALGQQLARHPEHWHDLRGLMPSASDPRSAVARDCLLRAVGADPAADPPVAAGSVAGSLDRLRISYRRHLLALAARDLTGAASVDAVAAELADLAAAALEAALVIARRQLPDEAGSCRLAVLALGKCGGRELNYVSDVDVLFVAEPAAGASEPNALRAANRLAAALMRNCSAHTGEGTLWPVDAALRPEGRAGPLTRTFHSHLSYYQRWAKTWEFQALLKARPVAGDPELGERFVAAVAPLVWQAAERESFVPDVQAMRRRVVGNLAPDADRELKLGPGGLRDIEFAVQLLQLVHGRTDETLRSGTTLVALEALTSGGYVGRSDGASLAAAYRFLRSLEHRIQLWQLRRTHRLPESEQALRRLARSLGYDRDPVAELSTALRGHAVEVRRLHERLFYRPLLSAVARLPQDEVRLSAAAARDRLTALGYLDPAAALRHIEAMTTGVSRRAAIQRTLLPVMLHWFAQAPAPDAGLLAFRQVSEALGSTHWYLRLLRDEGAVAQRMATVLSSSRYASELLMRRPEAVRMLADDDELRPLGRAAVESAMSAAASRQDAAEEAMAAIRAVRRRELLRIAVADIVGQLDVEAVGEALSDVTTAALGAATALALQRVELQLGQPLPMSFLLVAMGRLGGHEMSYASDADVMFVHEPKDGASEEEATAAASAVAADLRRLLEMPGPDPALHLDTDLRPEGRQGPLVRSFASYAAYYARWSHVWEAQALLRADPVVGPDRLRERFLALIDPLRWPPQGVPEADVREIRRLKARVDAERLPRGADRATHTKLGRGGLADIEWTVQLLQLRHASAVPGLRATRTLAGLRAAAAAGILDGSDADTLQAAWRSAARVRNALMLVRGRPSDSLPRSAAERAGVAYLCGYPTGDGERLAEDYRRGARRARTVIERLFSG
jgi:glutamate-ammonia-ligase adenylyltransferase